MDQEKVNRLLALTKDAGACNAEYFKGNQIVLDRQFRDICRTNACGRYGRCYMCPPDIGDVEEAMEKIKGIGPAKAATYLPPFLYLFENLPED